MGNAHGKLKIPEKDSVDLFRAQMKASLNEVNRADEKIRKAISDVRFALAKESLEGAKFADMLKALKERIKKKRLTPIKKPGNQYVSHGGEVLKYDCPQPAPKKKSVIKSSSLGESA